MLLVFLDFITFELNNVLARLSLGYNLIFLCVLITNLISNIKSKKLKNLYLILTLIFAFSFYSYLIYTNGPYWQAIIPYRCFLE